jgi:hypothetical protein
MIKYFAGNNVYYLSNEKEYKNYTNWIYMSYNEDDLYHRLDGPAIEYSNGDKFWYLNGKRHRLDGPAKEYSDGDKFWYKNDKFHREDGPAIERINGNKYYFYNGKKIYVSSDKEFKQYIKMKVFI